MSYLSDMQQFYPRSWKQRMAIHLYKNFCEWEGKPPTTVTIHQVFQCYGGPEEGGWWYNEGHPEVTHCVFNKKQAIKTLLTYEKKYGTYEQPDLGLSTTDSNWDINFSRDRARFYPTSRPHYE